MVQIKEFLNKYQSFAIVCHQSPDGDTLGSALALFFSLNKLGITAKVYCKDKLKETYTILPESDKVQTLDKITEEAIIFCDCANLSLAAMVNNTLPSMNIDHHISNENYADVNYVVPTASSACEVMYDVIKYLGVELDENICKCLYMGICTDTNNFTNSNVSSNTFAVMTELCKIDFGMQEIIKKIYRTRSKELTRAISMVIDNMRFYLDDKLCISYLTNDQLNELKLEGTEGLVNYTCDVKGVSVGVFIKESDVNVFKVSMRSNYDVNVQNIASVFGGGGHIKASGCKIESDLETTLERIVSEVSKWME